jgi:hypothetical protein
MLVWAHSMNNNTHTHLLEVLANANSRFARVGTQRPARD